MPEVFIPAHKLPKQKPMVPFWVPDHVAYQEHMKRAAKLIEQRMEQQRLEKDAGFVYERDQKLKDTKPDLIIDRTDPARAIVVVGAGEHWREDLKDMAKRKREQENPLPHLSKRNRLINDLDRQGEMVKAARKGQRVFHISGFKETK